MPGYTLRVRAVSATPTKRSAESGDALRLFDHGRERDTAHDLGARLRSFYRRHPLRVHKRGK